MKNSNWENILLKVILYGSALALIVPLLVFKQSYFPYIIQKTLVLRTILEVIFGAYLILIAFWPKYRPRLKSPLNLMIIAFGLVMIISTIFSASPFRSWWGNWERMFGTFNNLHYIFWYFALAGALKSVKDWSKLLNFSLLISGIICVYALAQRLNVGFVFEGGVERVNGTMGNAAFLAGYTLLHLFIATLLFFRAKQWPFKTIYFIALSLNALILFFTGTRGAIIGLFGALLILPFLAWRSEYKSTKAFKIIVVTVTALFITWLSLFIFKNHDVVKQNYWLARFTNFSLADNTVQTRMHSWSWGLQGFRDHLLIGVGPENYQLVFNQYFTGDFYDYSGNEIWFDRAHNILIDVASTMGIFGILSYLGLFGAAGWLLFDLRKKQAIPDGDFLILFSAIVAYFIQNIFVFDSLNTLLLFYLLLAYLGFAEDRSLEPEINRLPAVQKPGLKFLVVSGVIIFVGWLFFAFTLPEMKANKLTYNAYVAKVYNKYGEMVANYEKARELAVNKSDLGVLLSQSVSDFIYTDLPGVSKETKIVDLKKAISWLDFAIAREPQNMFFLYLQSKNYAVLFEMEQKKEYLDKGLAVALTAHELSLNNVRPLWSLGQLYLFYGQTDKALYYLDLAEKANPKLPETYFYKAIIYKYLKQEDKMYQAYDAVIDYRLPFGSAARIMEILPHYEAQLDKTREIYLLESLLKLANNEQDKKIISDRLEAEKKR